MRWHKHTEFVFVFRCRRQMCNTTLEYNLRRHILARPKYGLGPELEMEVHTRKNLTCMLPLFKKSVYLCSYCSCALLNILPWFLNEFSWITFAVDNIRYASTHRAACSLTYNARSYVIKYKKCGFLVKSSGWLNVSHKLMIIFGDENKRNQIQLRLCRTEYH